MTESGSGVVYDGYPLDGVELAVRPLEWAGADVAPGTTERDVASSRDVFRTPSRDDASAGEILIRAPMLFRRYRGGGDGRVTGPDGSADWYATGDAGHIDPDGRLWVSGRIDDVITTGAQKVWPDHVERVLLAHPDVAEVAVWKRTDPEWGERVVAWVVPSDDAPSLDALRQIVAESIAPWAAPKELVLVDDLPRTAAGKVRRRELEAYGGG
jgi:acyl-CoA synthetase (AMP-forming)/AMP-acid ligase II